MPLSSIAVAVFVALAPAPAASDPTLARDYVAPIELEPPQRTVVAPAPTVPIEAEAEAEPEGPVDERGADPDDYDPMRHSPEALRARAWLRSGIVALSAGVALGVTAIVMKALPADAPRGGNNGFADARDRAAWTVGIPALALLGGGTAMTTVGAVRLRRIRVTLAGVQF
jgi:hypothetical protein